MEKKYKGVSFHTRSQKYRATVSDSSGRYDCGNYHQTAREAAISRDKKIMTLNLNVKLQIFKPVQK